MKKRLIVFLGVLICCIELEAQSPKIDKEQFFIENNTLKASLVLPMGKLLNHTAAGKATLNARFICKLPDSSLADEKILVDLRGHFRRETCLIPPLKLVFDKPAPNIFSPLKTLKLVSTCKTSSDYPQYLIKEYLIYKMYNLFTEKSFRVRLLDLNYVDSSGKKKTMNNFAFFIEDEKEMAKRNDCKNDEEGKPPTESTNRSQMTLVAIFEYMIGNTDWSVPARHNIKTIRSKTDPGKLYTVPYDFDFSGLVNTDYSIPDPLMNTESVLERVYRGFPRTLEEINLVLEEFRKQKENIYAIVEQCTYLEKRHKQMMTSYLDDFYNEIKYPAKVKSIFIDNARTK